jgi:hypothetical protein
MLKLIEFGLLVVIIVVVLRLIRGGRKRPRPPQVLPPDSPNEHPGEKHDKPL